MIRFAGHRPVGHWPAIIASAQLVCVLLTSVQASAQSPSNELENVVVTAERYDSSGDVTFSSDQLTRDQLNPSATLDSALAQIAGLSLFRRGDSRTANPTTQGVSLRNLAPSGAGRALVLLNGVPQNDPFGGWVIWSALPAGMIETATVIRGAGAGAYGAGALTGTIALTENNSATGLALDIAAGTQQQLQGWSNISWATSRNQLILGGASAQGDGYIPVSTRQRGSADTALSYRNSTMYLRDRIELADNTQLDVRMQGFDEHHDSGLAQANSSNEGVQTSLELSHTQSRRAWRMQFWTFHTNLVNRSVSTSAGRLATSPSNDQFATPARGLGLNAAVRGLWQANLWELGLDARDNQGESRERYQYTAGAFTQQRIAGGHSITAGSYAQLTHASTDWLFTANLRLDHWRNDDGHLSQLNLLSAVQTEQQYPARHGLLPSHRLGLKRRLNESLDLRLASYQGFRIPTLNELYRPFRVGNNFTMANAALHPERLYGAEIGIDFAQGEFTGSITGFWNRLQDTITNVTQASGPLNLPGIVVLPAGGLLMQRLNAGLVVAPGTEFDLSWQPARSIFTARLSANWVNARMHGSDTAPQLDGKRPLQAAPWNINTQIVARLSPAFQLRGDWRSEGPRFADDLNTLRLGASHAVDLQLAWTPAATAQGYVTQVYATLSNALNNRTETSLGADGIRLYGAPRELRLGVRLGLSGRWPRS